MSLKEKLKSNPTIKKLVLWSITSSRNPRPRLWIRLFVNPLVHKKGKGTVIRRQTRIDVFPWNNFTLGQNCTIESFTTVNNGVGEVQIGNNSRVGIGNTIIGPVKIGNDVILAQNIVISGLNHGYQDVKIPIKDQPVTMARIIIEDEAWIGANSTIVSGVTIGKHSVVAAGSVVTKDVPPFSIVGGNPAKIIRKYSDESGKWERIKSNS